jgi:hypothetical protein
MAKLYQQFAEGWTGLDFSDESMIAMFNHESFGEPVDQRKNGFYVGKQWMSVTVAMWKEEQARGCFSVYEIYQDPRLPHWWLDGIFVGYQQQMEDDGFTFKEH